MAKLQITLKPNRPLWNCSRFHPSHGHMHVAKQQHLGPCPLLPLPSFLTTGHLNHLTMLSCCRQSHGNTLDQCTSLHSSLQNNVYTVYVQRFLTVSVLKDFFSQGLSLYRKFLSKTQTSYFASITPKSDEK